MTGLKPYCTGDEALLQINAALFLLLQDGAEGDVLRVERTRVLEGLSCANLGYGYISAAGAASKLLTAETEMLIISVIPVGSKNMWKATYYPQSKTFMSVMHTSRRSAPAEEPECDCTVGHYKPTYAMDGQFLVRKSQVEALRAAGCLEETFKPFAHCPDCGSRVPTF